MIDLSDRKPLRPLAKLLATVQEGAAETPMLLVGATARDLILVHVHGLEVQRATEDTDVALAVRNWDEFQGIRESLIATRAFKPDRRVHRLWLEEQGIDLIPFGGIERHDRSIEWPPGGAQVMNVRGFSEALGTALRVQLPNALTIRVASLPAQALLKIWAWKDRGYEKRGKDAEDLWILLRDYADAGNESRLYSSETEILTTSGFDVQEGGAWLLGKDARDVVHHGAEPLRALGVSMRF